MGALLQSWCSWSAIRCVRRARVLQLAERIGSNPIKCGFESHRGHSSAQVGELGERLELLEVVVQRVEQELLRAGLA